MLFDVADLVSRVPAEALWATILLLTVAVGALVALVGRRDPPVWSVLLVGALFAGCWSWIRPGSAFYLDWDHHALVVLEHLGEWAVGVGALHALIGLVARPRPDESDPDPGRPAGLASWPVLLGLVVGGIAVSSVLYGAGTGRPRPWPEAAGWLLQVPLSLLAVRGGARVARIRRNSASLAIVGGVFVLLPWVQGKGWAWSPSVPGLVILHGLLAAFGRPGPEPAIRRLRRRALVGALGFAAVGVAGLLGVTLACDSRLWLATRGLDAAAVPIADPASPRPGRGLRRLEVISAPRSPWDVRPGVRVLTREARVVEALTDFGPLHWVGFTPSGDVRVARLVGRRGGEWIVGVQRLEPVDGGPGYRLPGIEEPLSMEEVRRELERAREACPHQTIGLSSAGWTAQEVFDLCTDAEEAWSCAVAEHRSSCWDELRR